MGNPPLPMGAVTSLRKVTASFSLPHDVYRSSTKISRLTTAAAAGHSSLLSLVVRVTAKLASEGDDLSPNTWAVHFIDGGVVGLSPYHAIDIGDTCNLLAGSARDSAY